MTTTDTPVRPTPRALSLRQLADLSTEDLLTEVRTRRQLDPLTTALASRLRDLALVLQETRAELERLHV